MSTSPKFASRSIGSFAALAVAALVSFPPQASAQTPSASARPAAGIRIDVKDQTPEAVRRQIAVAVREVCRAEATHSPLFPRETSDCQRETEKQAIAQLGDAPQLMAAR